MLAAMKTAGVTLYSVFCYRFSPAALNIRELVRAGAIGKVGSPRLIYNWSLYNWSLHGKFTPDAAGNARRGDCAAGDG